MSSTPTGLKPVLDAIPERCYQRSTTRGLSLVGRDLILYGLTVWGLFSTNNILLLVPLWILAALTVSALFVIGHDAAHNALFDSKKLNSLVARLAMLPSLHATEIWIFGHNRVHHGHTLRQGMDFVWHPLTPAEFEQLSPLRRLQHRFEWGPLGSGAYYLRQVWWNKMVRFAPPKRWRRPMRRDQAIVAVFAGCTLAVLIAWHQTEGAWMWAKVVMIPFLLFCGVIGWVVHVHHIAPEIRWWPKKDWTRFRGQMEGTTIFRGPPGWDFFFHWIMVHVPHHVDMQIPCYRLQEAGQAIAAAFPDDVTEQTIRLRTYLHSVRTCKLHDFETGQWHPYPSLSAQVANE